MNIARIFSSYRLLESELARERDERATDRVAFGDEVKRLREERDREWNRANESEARARSVEDDALHMAARVGNVPLTPGQLERASRTAADIADRDRQRRSTVPGTTHSIKESIRLAEAASQERAANARAQAELQREVQIGSESVSFKGNGQVS